MSSGPTRALHSSFTALDKLDMKSSSRNIHAGFVLRFRHSVCGQESDLEPWELLDCWNSAPSENLQISVLRCRVYTSISSMYKGLGTCHTNTKLDIHLEDKEHALGNITSIPQVYTILYD